MRLSSRQAELFQAFSCISAKVFTGDRLISCPTLSKTPNYGNVLRRFLLKAPQSEAVPLSAVPRLAVRYILSNTAHFFFMLLSAAMARVLKWRRPEGRLLDPQKPLLLIDTFAVLPRLEKERTYRELYLPGLAEEAANQGYSVVHLYRLYGSRNPRTLWRSMTVLAEQPGMLEAHLLRCTDWFRLVWHMLAYPFALFRLIRRLRAYPQGSPQSYIREALISTAGQCVLIGEARRLAARRLGLLLSARPFYRQGVPAAGPGAWPERATHIVSWYENQTVNKCFMRGLRQAEKSTGRHILVTGAQLSLWPAALLNNHPDDGEAALGLAPDRVLVNGPHFLPERTVQHYAVGPSLRYAALFEDGLVKEESRSILPADRRDNAGTDEGGRIQDGPILALLPYYPEEVKRILVMLLPLAEEGREIIYKFHPTSKTGQFSAWLPDSPIIEEGTLKDALEKVKKRRGVVLGSISGALVEAVVAGIPVLSVQERIPEMGMNFLPEFGKGSLWESVAGAWEIEEATVRLTANLDRPDRERQVAGLREMLFTTPTPQRIRHDFFL